MKTLRLATVRVSNCVELSRWISSRRYDDPDGCCPLIRSGSWAARSPRRRSFRRWPPWPVPSYATLGARGNNPENHPHTVPGYATLGARRSSPGSPPHLSPE